MVPGMTADSAASEGSEVARREQVGRPGNGQGLLHGRTTSGWLVWLGRPLAVAVGTLRMPREASLVAFRAARAQERPGKPVSRLGGVQKVGHKKLVFPSVYYFPGGAARPPGRARAASRGVRAATRGAALPGAASHPPAYPLTPHTQLQCPATQPAPALRCPT